VAKTNKNVVSVEMSMYGGQQASFQTFTVINWLQVAHPAMLSFMQVFISFC